MDIVKPSILPGFMELNPKEQLAFNEIREIIKSTYEDFGFLPIDTPVIEKSEVLLAKGGGDTEKQVYRFDKGDTDLTLRFDLTVPLARYSTMRFSDLEFPFKRYQIAKVYRGERNQKGRFREFYQADVDIIGNGSLAIENDAEMPAIIYQIFKKLNFGPFTIKINNRKVLLGFYKSLGVEDPAMILRIIDKMDKVSEEKTVEALKEEGLDQKAIDSIFDFINIEGSPKDVIRNLKKLPVESDEFNLGLEELEKVISILPSYNIPEDYYKIDLKLQRGLDYYTGTIFETIMNDYPSLGSVCGGGRYDNLAGYYTDRKMPGVGVSIGLTRLFYQLNEAGLINVKTSHESSVLVVPMEGFSADATKVATSLRNAKITTQVYYEDGKMGKKFSYADKIGIRYVIVIGEDEVARKAYSIKDMKTGESFYMKTAEIVNKIYTDRSDDDE